MGKSSTTKRAAHRLKMLMTNDELRMTNLKSAVWVFVIFGVLCVSARNSLAQENVFTLKQVDRAAQLDFLSQAIADGSTEQKRDALLQIRNLESAEASQIAVAALRDKAEIVRATATASVVFLPANNAARNLIPLLADKSPFVRREAAAALGKVGDSSAVVSLLQILQKDKILEVRNAAIVALGAIGDVSAVGDLIVILQKKPAAKEEFARRSAARSVGQIAQIIQTGKIVVLTPESFLPEKFQIIELPKYPKLAESFPAFRPAISTLIETLQNPKEFPDVKREAAFALGAIGDESAIPILQANINSDDYYLAEICRESLRKIAADKFFQN